MDDLYDKASLEQALDSVDIIELHRAYPEIPWHTYIYWAKEQRWQNPPQRKN